MKSAVSEISSVSRNELALNVGVHSHIRRLTLGSSGHIVLGTWRLMVISRVTILITHIGGLITTLITTHEPPSKALVPQTTRAYREAFSYRLTSKEGW